MMGGCGDGEPTITLFRYRHLAVNPRSDRAQRFQIRFFLSFLSVSPLLRSMFAAAWCAPRQGSLMAASVIDPSNCSQSRNTT